MGQRSSALGRVSPPSTEARTRHSGCGASPSLRGLQTPGPGRSPGRGGHRPGGQRRPGGRLRLHRPGARSGHRSRHPLPRDPHLALARRRPLRAARRRPSAPSTPCSARRTTSATPPTAWGTPTTSTGGPPPLFWPPTWRSPSRPMRWSASAWPTPWSAHAPVTAGRLPGRARRPAAARWTNGARSRHWPDGGFAVGRREGALRRCRPTPGCR